MNVRKTFEESMKSIFKFKRPSKKTFEKLRAIISELESSPFSEDSVRSMSNVGFVGNLPDLCGKLFEIIETDCKNNLADKDAPWRFDYVVCEDERHVHALLVATHLFSESKPGNIFYGRLIKRVGKNRFLMWVDD